MADKETFELNKSREQFEPNRKFELLLDKPLVEIRDNWYAPLIEESNGATYQTNVGGQ